MAFTPETLGVIVQPIGGEGMRFISYRTDDDQATVTATGYFAGAADYGIRVHDLIFVSPLTADFDPYALVVDSVDAAGDATGVIGEDEMLKSIYDPQNIAADAFDRANHTGSQAISTVTGLQAALDAKLDDSQAGTTGLALLGAETVISQAEAEAGTATTPRAWSAERVKQAIAARTDYVPTGTVLPFAGTTAPTDYLLCYGQAVSRTTYAGLFAVIGTTYGAGDGSTTFNLPDLRGRVIAGQDDMGGTSANRLTNQSGGVNGDTLGATGGAETHTLTAAQMPSHTHDSGTLATGSAGSHSHTLADNAWAGTKSDSGGSSGSINVGTATTQSTNSAGAHTHTITGSTASAGSDAAHNNVQPTIILNYIIRT